MAIWDMYRLLTRFIENNFRTNFQGPRFGGALNDAAEELPNAPAVHVRLGGGEGDDVEEEQSHLERRWRHRRRIRRSSSTMQPVHHVSFIIQHFYIQNLHQYLLTLSDA